MRRVSLSDHVVGIAFACAVPLSLVTVIAAETPASAQSSPDAAAILRSKCACPGDWLAETTCISEAAGQVAKCLRAREPRLARECELSFARQWPAPNRHCSESSPRPTPSASGVAQPAALPRTVVVGTNRVELAVVGLCSDAASAVRTAQSPDCTRPSICLPEPGGSRWLCARVPDDFWQGYDSEVERATDRRRPCSLRPEFALYQLQHRALGDKWGRIATFLCMDPWAPLTKRQCEEASVPEGGHPCRWNLERDMDIPSVCFYGCETHCGQSHGDFNSGKPCVKACKEACVRCVEGCAPSCGVRDGRSFEGAWKCIQECSSRCCGADC